MPRNTQSNVVLTLKARCVKLNCHHIVSFWVNLFCKHLIKKETLNQQSKLSVIFFCRSVIWKSTEHINFNQ